MRLVTSLILALLLVVTIGRPAEAAAPRAAIVELSIVQSPGLAVDAIRKTVAREVGSKGWTVADLPSCAGAECAQAARAAGATYLIELDPKYETALGAYKFTVSMQLLKLSTGEGRKGDLSVCDPCYHRQILETVGGATRALLASEPASTAEPQAPGTAAPAVVPPGAGSNGPVATARARPLWAKLAVGAGAAVAVAGVALWIADGHTTSCQSINGSSVCLRRFDTLAIAVPLVVVGAAGIGVGVWGLVGSGHDQGATAHASSAWGLALRGAF